MTLAAGALTPAPAVPQEPAATVREAFAAVVRAGEAIERAADGSAIRRAAERAVSDAEHAANAFTAADRARDAALVAYRAAYREALAGAVTCANGYPCTNGRVDPFEGFTAAFAAHFELIAAVSAANAAYVDTVGIRGADAARARAARIQGLAGRMRDPEAIDEPGRWNALVASVGAEIGAGSALHRRATASRHAADRAFVDDVTRVMQALHASANRIGPRARGAAGVDAREVSDAVLGAAIETARDAMESLRSLLVAAASSEPDVVPGEETALAGNVVPARAEETAGPRDSESLGPGPAPAETRPADDVAARAETLPAGDVAGWAGSRPADDVAAWAGALTAAARAAEQAAADAEAAAGGSGSARARAAACSDAEARVTAAAARVTSLTVGADRPRYVPARTGRETYNDLFHLLDAAKRRARAACGSLDQSR